MRLSSSHVVWLAASLSLMLSWPLHAQCPGPPGGQQEVEPNNSSATANAVALWSFQGYFVGVRAAIDSPGDVDYYSFSVTTAGSRVWLLVDTGGAQTAGSSRDSVVSVLAPDGSTVLEEDDDDGTGTGRDTTAESFEASVIAGLQLAAPGTYYVRVRAKNLGDVISRYVLALGVTNTVPQAESEPNDNPQFVPPAAPVNDGSLSSATDLDWYNVGVLDNGYPLVIVDGDPERDGSSTDVVLRIEGFNGVLQTDSSTGNGQPAPGAEGFLVENYGANVRISGSAPGTYRLGVLYSGEACPVPVALQSFTIR
jgi:Bacterial pre-peptidase C-terminal domain